MGEVAAAYPGIIITFSRDAGNAVAGPGRHSRGGSGMGWIAVALVALLSLPAHGTASQLPAQRSGADPSQRPPKELLPRTAGDLRVRFSPDGRYILAQEDFRITVLTAQPFRALFRIPAENPGPAEFTPDSKEIVFVSSVASVELTSPSSPAHVERWTIAERARVGFAEIRQHGCDSKGLSPGGLVLACVDFDGTLRLLDVASGETIFEKRKFGKPFILWVESQWHYGSAGGGAGNTLNLFPRYELGDPGSAKIGFSPDGRFVVAMPRDADGSTVAFDLHTRRTVSLRGCIRKLDRSFQYSDFAFAGADRLVLSALVLQHRTTTAALVAFPSGRVLSRRKVPPGPVFPAADPRFVLIRPCGPFPCLEPYPRCDSNWDRVKKTGAYDWHKGQLTVSRTPALDVFGDHYVSESADGEIGLYERGKAAAVATVRLDGQ